MVMYTEVARDEVCNDGMQEGGITAMLEASVPLRAALDRVELEGGASIATGDLTRSDTTRIFMAQLLFDLERLLDDCGSSGLSNAMDTADYVFGSTDAYSPETSPGYFSTGCTNSTPGGGGVAGRACLQQAINAEASPCELGPAADTPLPETAAEWEAALGDKWDELSEEQQELFVSKMNELQARVNDVDNLGDVADLVTFVGAVFVGLSALILGYIGIVTSGGTATPLVVEGEMSILTLIGGVGTVTTGFSALVGSDIDNFVEDVRESIKAFKRYTRGTYECVNYGASGSGHLFTFTDPVMGDANSTADLLRQCLCNAAFDETGGHNLLPPSSCSLEGGDRRDCLTNPFGPDDGYNLACLGMLEEDLAAWNPPSVSIGELFCSVIQCPMGFAPIDEGDSCGCESIDSGVGDPNDCEAYLCPSGVPASSEGDRCGCGSFFGARFDEEQRFHFEVVDEIVKPVISSFVDPTYYEGW